MELNGWKYYNHAAISTMAPHQMPDMHLIQNGEIWKIKEGTPLLVRWTTDFDCDYETNWWYVIKDTPFDINSLKAKRRYEINKGLKNFKVEQINPLQYVDEIYLVTKEAYSAYTKRNCPVLNEIKFKKAIEEWPTVYDAIYGAFFNETGVLCGYVLLKYKEKCIDLVVLKTCPSLEKKE